jgi:AraC-like DNA-binding protein
VDTLVTRTPGPALSSFVETLWFYNPDTTLIQQDAVLPHGAFELVISLSGPLENSLLSGPQTKPMVIDPVSIGPIVGAHFRPGGATAIFGHTARDFRNLDVPLEDVLSKRACRIQEELQSASSPHECLASLEHFLTRSALLAKDQHPAVSLAVEEFHLPFPVRRIRDLVEESGVSQRRFIELFTDHVGLTPKLYARIQRFQRTLRRAAGTKSVDWASLACDNGYSDQAHLIREFREFAGLRPSEYQPRWPGQPNHVPLS